MAASEPVPFGVTVSTDNLEGAREFYTKMYPDYESMTEGIFGTIKYFSLMGKDGEVLSMSYRSRRTIRSRCHSDAQGRFS